MKQAIFPLALMVVGTLCTPPDDALQEFIAGNHKFTAAVYKELVKTTEGNLIFSPFSAETVLALTQEGAKGETAAEMTTGLHLPSTREKTRKAFTSFLPKLKISTDYTQLSTANKIYVGNDVKLDDSFKNIAEKVYESGVENVNFAKSAETANKINQWVEDHTNKRIKNLIQEESITELTKMILVNALYFKDRWVNEFENYTTTKKNFYRSKTNFSEVDMMRQTENFKYYENPELNAKFLELPYEGSGASMVIVLPNEIDGLSKLEQNIDKLLEPQPFTNERVDLELPKFRIETKIEFVPILQKLGIHKLFDRADLSGLSSNTKGLVVSDVIQKVFIEVNEAGTEAAASTAVGIALLSATIIVDPVLQIFHADHPFIFYLKDSSGVLLFIGKHLR